MTHVVRSIALLLTLLTALPTFAQLTPGERRQMREYTPPDALVSIAPTTTFDKALTAISEVSKKFVGKIIIDTERRDFPIGVDIQGMFWRDALESICRKNNVWYTEYENYIQISATGGQTAEGGQPGNVATTKIEKEPATFRSREIKISATFFEVNLTRLEEVGINWNFLKSTSNIDVDLDFNGADLVKGSGDIILFNGSVVPKVSFANMSFLARLFSNYELGDIISSPQVIVRSGEEGRIQVGQDFSIRERDFAGNIIDKFYSAGTIVKVTPQVINEQGVNFVHLNINVERSNVVPGAISTIINKSQAETNILLLDNEETIIGGLYNSEVTETRTGLPFLKDLPWYIFGLRYLFGYSKEQYTKKELVILLKAEIVPTLQERIAQRVKGETQYDMWRANREDEQARMRGKK